MDNLEARVFAQLSIDTGAPSEPLARVVLRLLDDVSRLTIAPDDVAILRRHARKIADDKPITSRAIVAVLDAQRKP